MVSPLLLVLVLMSTTLAMFAQAQKVRTPAPKYLDTPLDLAWDRLPPHFLGHDIIGLYSAAKRLQGAEKAEYETSDQFKKRIEGAEFEFFMGSASENLLAFITPAISKYDADTGILRMGVKLADPGGAQTMPAIVVWRVEESRNFVATNVYGARVPAHKAHVDSYQVAVDNAGAFPVEVIGTGDDGGSKDLIVASVRTSVDEARRIKATLSGLAICAMKKGKPLTSEDSILQAATFDHPEEYSEDMHFLNTSLVAIWFFDESGRVFARVKPQLFIHTP